MNLADFYRDVPMMQGYGHDDQWAGALLMLLIVLVIAGLAIYLIKSVSRNNSTGPTEVRDPLDIAKERYAKGEITKEELTDIKKNLK